MRGLRFRLPIGWFSGAQVSFDFGIGFHCLPHLLDLRELVQGFGVFLEHGFRDVIHGQVCSRQLKEKKRFSVV